MSDKDNNDAAPAEISLQAIMSELRQQRTELQEYRQLVQAFESTNRTPTSSTKEDDIKSSNQVDDVDFDPKIRQKLPHCSKFSGDRKTFPAWLIEMRNKLTTDGKALGSDRSRFGYIFSCLEQKPKDTVIAFVRLGGNESKYNPDELLSYLETNYDDPNAEKRSLDKLRVLRQNEKESFNIFLPRFERELADSGGMVWPDQIKINYLEGALNESLLTALVTVEMPSAYTQYVRQCQKTGSRLDSLKYRNGASRNSNNSGPSTWKADKPKGKIVTEAAIINDSDAMEWEPTQAVKVFKLSDPKLVAQLTADNERLKGKRAKWVSQEEFRKRLHEKRCIRCGRTYCNKEICPLLPPLRPDSSKDSRVRVAKPVMKAMIEDDEPSGSDEEFHDGSGKE